MGIAASRIIPWVKLHWRVESAPHLEDLQFFFRGQGFSAEMKLSSSGDFVVLAGSKARAKTTATIPRGTLALRKTLMETGVLQEDGDFLKFANDYSFSSASAAAATVIGASANGRILWKLPDGRTYGDWESNDDGGNVDPHTGSEGLAEEGEL